ncbi:MAG: hypothetical protein NTY48_05140 [Candidatus Diapherotrites archaeon]|nr:hypothetical protein [Candidatus Diapherotrites archaeon]
MNRIKIMDKDLIITKDENIFLARGYLKKDSINVILKYYPSNKNPGFTFKNKHYTWNTPDYNIKFLCKNPQYFTSASNTLLQISMGQIKEIIKPGQWYLALLKKNKLNKTEKLVVEIGEIFSSIGIPHSHMGITGTLLMGHHNALHSDIDFVIKGSKSFKKAIKLIQKHKQFEKFKLKDWAKYYKKYLIQKNYSQSFVEFLRTAKRKHDRLFFRKTPLSIFNVRENKEIRAEENAINLFLVCAKGKITNDAESSFYPSIYKIKANYSRPQIKHKIKEIIAYGREYYLEGFKGDAFECQGMLQYVTPNKGRGYFRIAIGYFGKDLHPQGFLKIL